LFKNESNSSISIGDDPKVGSISILLLREGGELRYYWLFSQPHSRYYWLSFNSKQCGK